MRIAVCAPQVPFERGGAEIFAADLVGELRTRGHETDLVTVPYKWYPGERVLSQAFLWRLLDLSESDGRPIELAIATKFPSYAVRHPNKVVWLLHQFRQAYELDRTELGQFGESVEERATRRAVQRLDRARRRGDAAPAAGAAVPDRGLRGLRPLGRPARPPQATRPPARGARCRRDAPMRDRRRRPRPRTARGGRPAPRPGRPRALCGARRRGAARGPVRPLPRRLLRAGGRGLRDGPVRGVPRREAGRDDHRFGRAARGRGRPPHRPRLRAAAGRARGSLLVAAATHRRGEGLGSGGEGDRAPGLLGRDDRAPVSVTRPDHAT